MSLRDDRTALRHMLDHANEALDMASAHDRNDLDTDRQFGLAIVRLLEIIGEAANRVSLTVRERIPEVPWSRVVGMRNRLIHGYDSVDFDIVWEVVAQDLPPLIEVLQRAVDETQ